MTPTDPAADGPGDAADGTAGRPAAGAPVPPVCASPAVPVPPAAHGRAAGAPRADRPRTGATGDRAPLDDTVRMPPARNPGGLPPGRARPPGPGPGDARRHAAPPPGVLLDDLASWGPVTTAAGSFHLLPVEPDSDLPLLTRWMNDPAVAAFWELEGPPATTLRHLAPQLGGDGRSVPCLGILDGKPMSYWEVYRADLDPLARHYPARPHDTGIHLLIGGVGDRGRGLGSILLRAVADHILDNRPACARIVAEPDLRNTPSVAAFLHAGFRLSAEIDLPDKQAALMIRDRAHRASPDP